jgi:hypothetical protein
MSPADLARPADNDDAPVRVTYRVRSAALGNYREPKLNLYAAAHPLARFGTSAMLLGPLPFELIEKVVSNSLAQPEARPAKPLPFEFIQKVVPDSVERPFTPIGMY